MRILKWLLETKREVLLWIDQRAPGFAGCWSFNQNVFFIIAAYVVHLADFFTFLGGFGVRFPTRNDGNETKSREKAGKVISQPFNGRSAPGYDDGALADCRSTGGSRRDLGPEFAEKTVRESLLNWWKLARQHSQIELPTSQSSYGHGGAASLSCPSSQLGRFFSSIATSRDVGGASDCLGGWLLGVRCCGVLPAKFR